MKLYAIRGIFQVPPWRLPAGLTGAIYLRGCARTKALKCALNAVMV